ncbi:MAG: hypothetical protein WBG86_02315, partial [Polyangiales bacterium]
VTPYAYADNAPTFLVDPTGHSAQDMDIWVMIGYGGLVLVGSMFTSGIVTAVVMGVASVAYATYMAYRAYQAFSDGDYVTGSIYVVEALLGLTAAYASFRIGRAFRSAMLRQRQAGSPTLNKKNYWFQKKLPFEKKTDHWRNYKGNTEGMRAKGSNFSEHQSVQWRYDTGVRRYAMTWLGAVKSPGNLEHVRARVYLGVAAARFSYRLGLIGYNQRDWIVSEASAL